MSELHVRGALAKLAGAVSRGAFAWACATLVASATPPSEQTEAIESEAADLSPIEAMGRVVEDIRRELPLRLDDETTLVDLTIDDQGLTYFYELGETPVRAPSQWRARLQRQSAEVRFLNCLNPMVVSLVELGYSVRFSYELHDEAIWTLSLSAEDCAPGPPARVTPAAT